MECNQAYSQYKGQTWTETINLLTALLKCADGVLTKKLEIGVQGIGMCAGGFSALRGYRAISGSSEFVSGGSCVVLDIFDSLSTMVAVEVSAVVEEAAAAAVAAASESAAAAAAASAEGSSPYIIMRHHIKPFECSSPIGGPK